MKKIIIVLCFFFCLQTSFSQGIQFGIKAGADFNSISGKAFEEKFTFGYHAGLFTQITLSPTLSLQSEVYYSEVKHDTASGFTTLLKLKPIQQIKLGYINVPFLVNIKPSKSLALQLGAQYGMLTQNNIITDVVNNTKDAIKKGDLSGIVGVQLYVANFRIYARYQVGLTDVKNYQDILDQGKWKNQTVHVGAGIRLF